jgi:hypothetical protein
LDIGFIDHLYTRLGNTSSYSGTSNLHNSQIATTSAKHFHLAVSSSAVPWQWLLTVEKLQLHALQVLSSPYRTNLVAPIVSLKIPPHGPSRKTCSNSTSIVARQFVALGTCLVSCCLETSLALFTCLAVVAYKLQYHTRRKLCPLPP